MRNLSRIVVCLPLLMILAILPMLTSAAPGNITVYADPFTIPLDGTTTIHISGVYPVTINTITVTAPGGTVYTYVGPPALPQTITTGEFTVTFGTSASDRLKWSPASNTGLKGDYIIYVNGVEGTPPSRFTVETNFWVVPEFAVGTATITALGFAGLTLARRKFKNRK